MLNCQLALNVHKVQQLQQGVLCLKMTLLTILNEIPKKTPAFFLAKPARFGSKKWHQKDISTINAQSTYAKIVSITNIFTSAKLLCIKYVLHFNGPQ